MKREFIYIDHPNTIDYIIMADGRVPSLASVTKMALYLGKGLIIDSVIQPSAFDWTRTVTNEEAAIPVIAARGIKAGDPKLVLALGYAGIPAGKYTATLIIYDLDHVDGLVWGKIDLAVE